MGYHVVIQEILLAGVAESAIARRTGFLKIVCALRILSKEACEKGAYQMRVGLCWKGSQIVHGSGGGYRKMCEPYCPRETSKIGSEGVRKVCRLIQIGIPEWCGGLIGQSKQTCNPRAVVYHGDGVGACGVTVEYVPLWFEERMGLAAEEDFVQLVVK